jgi:hypothetical protein
MTCFEWRKVKLCLTSLVKWLWFSNFSQYMEPHFCTLHIQQIIYWNCKKIWYTVLFLFAALDHLWMWSFAEINWNGFAMSWILIWCTASSRSASCEALQGWRSLAGMNQWWVCKRRIYYTNAEALDHRSSCEALQRISGNIRQWRIY